jgi:O-methyltransferase
MFRALKSRLRNSGDTVELLRQAVAGIANQSDLINRKLEEVIAGVANQSDLINRKHDRLVEAIGVDQSRGPAENGSDLSRLMERMSLLLDKRTEKGATQEAGSEHPAAALADLCVAALNSGEDRVAFFDRLVATLLPIDHSRVFWGDRMLLLDKNMGFMNDPRFAAAYDEIKENKAFNQYKSPHTECWRLHLLVWAAQHALALDGDFVECGAFRGDRASVITQMTDFARQKKTFYLYDTFSGFAPAYSSPADFPDGPGFFDHAHKLFSEPGIFEGLTQRFRDYPNVRIVRGVLPDILADVVPDKIAFMHMDLNSPAASVGSLEVLFDRIVPGGMVIFDDYGWYAYRREKELEDPFVASRGHQILELPTGQGLLVKR